MRSASGCPPFRAGLAPDVDRVARQRRRQLAGPRFARTSVAATACDAVFSGLIRWITSSQPSDVEGVVPSPRRRLRWRNPCRARRGGRSSRLRCRSSHRGNHGPAWPIQRPLAFSTTENIANPCTIQAPGICRKRRHASCRDSGPPMVRRFVREHVGVALEIAELRQAKEQARGFQRRADVRIHSSVLALVARHPGASRGSILILLFPDQSQNGFPFAGMTAWLRTR